MNIWKFLHITFMFGFVGLSIGGFVLNRLTVRSNDMGGVSLRIAWEGFSDKVGLVFFWGGVILGFVTAVTSGISLTAPWLVTAYILLGLGIVTSLVLYFPAFKRIKAAAETAIGDVPPEVNQELNSIRIRATEWIWSFVFVAVIFTMVAKPFT